MGDPMSLPGIEPDLPTVRAKLACIDTTLAFFRLVDNGLAAQAAELFTDDGRLTAAGNSVVGKPALRTAMQARQDNVERRTAHLLATPTCELISPTEARTEALLQFYLLAEQPADGSASPNALTRVRDRLVRGPDGRWLIAERVLTLLAGKV
jgi:hypothetical protein